MSGAWFMACDVTIQNMVGNLDKHQVVALLDESN